VTERSNEDWLRSLGTAEEEAVAELREVLRRGLRRALAGRDPLHSKPTSQSLVLAATISSALDV